MTDKEQNRSEVHQEPISKDIAGMNSRGKDRRHFIKRAIVAAPFILTVASRPVWAANCTMSGQLSGNISDGDECCGGQGCTVEKWINNIDKWHHEFQPGCLFDSVFGTNVFGTCSLSDVISSQNLPDNVILEAEFLGSEAVAALQNAATYVSSVLTVSEVIVMVEGAFSGTKDQMGSMAQILHDHNDDGCPF